MVDKDIPPVETSPPIYTSALRRPGTEEDEASYSHSGTIDLSAFSPPIRSIHPLLPFSVIHPITLQVQPPSTPRLISATAAFTPHAQYHPSPPDPSRQPIAHRGSPAPSSIGSLTVRPGLLGSNQSTLKPLLPALLSPWRHTGGDTKVDARGKSWQETDSHTARKPERPGWIGSLGEVKMVDELEVEMCVLCGRAMGRSEVEVKEFELGGAAAGLHLLGTASGSGGGWRNTDGEGLDQMMDGLGLGVGRWMICRDTASCDAAVENAVFADDEDEG